MAYGTIPKPYKKESEIGNISFYETYIGSIQKSSSATFNIPNSYKGLVITFGVANNMNGLYLINTSSSGAVSCLPVLSASDLTITKATNSLTIANRNENYAAICHAFSVAGGIPTI